MAFGAYAMPSNKISQRLEFDYDHPILSYLSYGVMEFQGKNYITLYNYRFSRDEKSTYQTTGESKPIYDFKFNFENSTYPKTRIYLLKGNKRELKCTY
ncbi:hypothetical protein B6S12_10545, partial [Helicobacter valdiviensis]